MISRVAIINGPNLNLLGAREQDIYGSRKFEDFLDDLRHMFPAIELMYYQSNHEGQLIDWLHTLGFGKVNGIVLNAGGYAHTSIAIRDAIEAIAAPVVDVHISDIYSREDFRRINHMKDVCLGSIVGEGLDGYRQAIKLIQESS